MISLDRRTRKISDVRAIDPSNFFVVDLPKLIQERSHQAVPGAKEFNLASMTFMTTAGDWTLTLSGDHLVLEPGGHGNTALRLPDNVFSDIINDISTPDMLAALGRISLERGDRSTMNGWWAVLRALLDDRPFYTAGSVTFCDRRGQRLDLNRSFGPGDDAAEMAQFLSETGFLHLSGWLDEALMEAIANDIDRVLPTCNESDGSWWVTLKDGSHCPVRIPDFAAHSDAVRTVLQSEAFLRIGRLTRDEYVPPAYVEALQKPIGVAEGISDIRWHSDCTQGMHSYKCCSLVVGVSVTAAGPGSAQLGVLPGSHRALMPVDQVYPHTGFEPLFLSTKAGDMTVHCSCILHMAQAPTVYERKALYMAFSLRELDEQTLLQANRSFEKRYDAQKRAGQGMGIG